MTFSKRATAEVAVSHGSRGVVETAIDLAKSPRSSSWERSVRESAPKAARWDEKQKKATTDK